MHKNISIRIMTIIMVVLLITLLIPSIINKSIAVEKGSSVRGIAKSSSTWSYYDGDEGWKNAKNNGYLYIGSTFFKNDFVFCIQQGQDLRFRDFNEGGGPLKYTVSNELKIDGQKSSACNGLAYILSQTEGRNNESDWTNFMGDPIQMALWRYLYVKYDVINTDLNIKEKAYNFVQGGGKVTVTKISQDEGYLTYHNDTENKTYGGNNNTGKRAYNIYTQALEIAKGDGTEYYSAIVYILKNTYYQRLMLVEDVSSGPKTPTINLKFYKTDFDEKALGNAEIQVTGSNNVSVSGTLSKSASDNGYFGQLKLTPTTNNGTVKVKLKETVTPSNYKGLPSEVELTIKYDTSNGKVTSITADENSNYFTFGTGSTGVIKVKNEYNPPVGLRFYKTDISGGTYLNGSTIKIEAGDNVKSFGSQDEWKNGKTSNNSGYYGGFIVKPESNTGKFELKITEITAPAGYNVILDEGKTITLTVSYNQKTGEPTGITVANSYKRNFGWKGTVDGKNVDKVGVIHIKDDPRIITDLIINKKDKSGKGAVEGATFKVYFNNITYVKIDGKTYVVEDIIKENKIIDRNGTKYYTKTANGLTLLVPNDSSKDRLYIEGLKTDKNGQIKIDEIEAIKNKDIVYVTVTETAAPKGYAILPEAAKLLLKYNNSGSNKWELFIRDGSVLEEDSKNYNKLDSEYYSLNSGKLTLTLKDDFKIDRLTILKTDSQNSSTKLQGAKFNITLSNIKSAKGYSANASGKIILTGVTTDANGNIVLEDLVISNINNPITIIIEETQAPVGYKKLEGTITVTLTRSGSTYKVSATKSEKMSDSEFKTDNVKIENNEVVLNINNIPVMNLGGIVWEDGQTGVKDVTLPDGTKGDKETGIAGIQVTLYKEGESNPITKDIYGNTLMTKTASAGDKLTYKMYNGKTDTITLEAGEYIFPNLEKGANYYVVFTYDGINYQTTKLSGDLYKDNNESKVTEVSKDTFNAKFKTISDSTTKDTNANSYAKADGASEDLVYSYVGEENGVKRSNLVTTDSNGNVLDNYKMTAKSANYLKNAADWEATWTNDGKINKNHYAIDINCGLIKKYFDLAIGMDVESAKLTINDKETTYTYNQILSGAFDDDIKLDTLLNNNISTNSDIIYNLYLYSSDYNYRISDYIMSEIDGTVGNKDVEDGTTVKEDAQIVTDNTNDIDKQLRAFVTYKVIIKNQSTINSARVNELAYYYDQNYKFVSATDANGNAITFTDDNTISQINGKKAAKVTGFTQNLTSPNYRQELYFTFEIQRDSNGALPASIGENGIECANIVEILSYSTDEGLIDNDSCPGNAAIAYEDDTDEAQGLNVTVKDNTRTISGIVWDDSTDSNATDGVKNEGAKGINDVIVQLIEVKKINGKYYEYIWQETRSGSKTVETTNRNGYTGNSYTVSNQEGQYQFTDFIPGNYIIRFIYGDGRVYDITDSVKTYNGQDYQSTVDKNYKEEWYNTSNYSNNSVARDNEARRLKVMSYSTTINEETWNKLNSKDKTMLQNTWMCAETSKINIPIDTENISTTEPNTAVSFTYQDNTITLGDMNFGLIKRPETKLVLEKHITGIKITPTGTGVQPIVDAKLKNIVDILNKNTIEQEDLTGITTGLSTIKSSRDERGFWKVETDIEELAQGATLEVEYTYVIKNESDVDYLSDTLITAYKNQDTKPYSEVLNEICTTVKGTMRNGEYSYSNNNKIGTYLGQYYYTKTKGSTDAVVVSIVDTVEDYLENQLKLSEQTSGIDFKKSNTGNVTQNMYDTEGYKKDLTIETVIQNKEAFNPTIAKGENEIKAENADYTKTVSLTTTLSASNKEITYPGYIAQIMQYSNAAGRRDMDACPGNLNYIHSEDNEITLNSYVKYNNDGTRITGVSKNPEAGYVRLNEDDEYWGCGGEKIMVTKPTGEDKQAPLQIAIIAISSIAVLGVGIVLIKKFVLKK